MRSGPEEFQKFLRPIGLKFAVDRVADYCPKWLGFGYCGKGVKRRAALKSRSQPSARGSATCGLVRAGCGHPKTAMAGRVPRLFGELRRPVMGLYLVEVELALGWRKSSRRYGEGDPGTSRFLPKRKLHLGCFLGKGRIKIKHWGSVGPNLHVRSTRGVLPCRPRTRSGEIFV